MDSPIVGTLQLVNANVLSQSTSVRMLRGGLRVGIECSVDTCGGPKCRNPTTDCSTELDSFWNAKA